MKGQVRKLLALTPEERQLFLRALLWLPQTALMLRLRGFRHCYERRTPSSSAIERNDISGTDTLARATNTQRLVSVAARYGLIGGNCLSRSLTLLRLLHRQGINAELRIGARGTDDRFEAHAWIEWDGIVLNDTAKVATRYSSFAPAAESRPGDCV